MDRALHAGLVSFALCIAVTVSAVASADAEDQAASSSREPDDPVLRRLEQMQQQIESLKDENQSMRSELNDLRAKTGDNWLTEQRAEEIRGIVTDVLADADTRAGYLQSGLIAGWDDGFFLGSTDGRFRLALDGLVQVRLVYNYIDDNRSSFVATDRHRWGLENTRTKLTFRGHVYDQNVTYLIRGNFARNATDAPNDLSETRGGFFKLQDAWVRYQFNEYWSARGGQFKLPFNREELVSPAAQLAVERSLINEGQNLGRSQGIELTYQDDVNRFTFAWSDGATDTFASTGTLAGTSPQNTGALVTDTEYSWTTRYERLISGTWSQFKDFTSPVEDPFGLLVGVAAHVQREESTNAFTANEDENQWLALTTDISAEFGGANAFAAFHYARVDNAQANFNDIFELWGVVVQGGMYITPKWEAFARYEFGWWEAEDFDFADLHVLTFGAIYYMEGHDLKWTSDFGITLNEVEAIWDSNIAGFRSHTGDTDPQLVFRTQFQLQF